MSETVLYDIQGPRARRRIRIASVVGAVFVLAVLAVIAARLAANAQFAPEKWAPFVDTPALYTFLWTGLLYTLLAAAFGLVLALTVGLLLAVGRLSTQRPIRLPSVSIVEFFRSVPLLLLMLFFFLGFPIAFGIELAPLWSVVFALTLYNGAVICEIVRAGVLSLPRGQSEAAAAIGLRRGQALRIILLPQALRLMLPALISQLVVLVKDSALGFIVGYNELLSNGQAAARQLGNPIQIYALIAVVYILLNSVLSGAANYVDRRQRRKYGTGAARSRAAEEAEVG